MELQQRNSVIKIYSTPVIWKVVIMIMYISYDAYIYLGNRISVISGVRVLLKRLLEIVWKFVCLDL